MMIMRHARVIEKVKGQTEVERFEQSSTENRRLLKQEELILDVTEALSVAIEESGLTRSELAKRLGKTKGFVSQLLAGGRNLTLRTVADIADAIGVSLAIAVERPQLVSSKNGQVEGHSQIARTTAFHKGRGRPER
jgi:ribosome-binding protein aMBF1 (putative translation factor)